MARGETLLTIVEDRLRADGFDGLFNPGECSCVIGDLFPCGSPSPDCEPGYKVPGCSCGEGCDFHVARSREVESRSSGGDRDG
jgi:hypothetical protein